MGHLIKTMYKRAEAAYSVTGAPHACIVTLLHYAGPGHNRPPARIIVTDSAAPGTLTDDIHAFFQSSRQPVPGADPLFAHNTARTSYIDHVV